MSPKPCILIIDDDIRIFPGLSATLGEEYQILTASCGVEGVELLQRHQAIDCVILDIRMPGMDGIETAESIRAINRSVHIVFYTGYPGDHDQRKLYHRFHPYSFIAKAEDPVVIKNAVRNAIRTAKSEFNRETLVARALREWQMVGSSDPMITLYREIDIVAKLDTPVLILGESGTGKQLVAEALHRKGNRSSQPFLETTIGNEDVGFSITKLFGRSAGTFAGAAEEPGLLELADGGVLFIDEVADLGMDTQTHLLKFLDKGEFTRLGSAQIRRADVRLIFATNKNLEKMIEDGTFRADLFARIKRGRIIQVPALRERKTDIPDLFHYFLDNSRRKHRTPYMDLESGAMEILMEHDWPGNVGELKAFVERLVIFSDPCSLIRAETVSSMLKVPAHDTLVERSYKDDLYELERNYWWRQVRASDSPADLARRKLIDPAFLTKKLDRFQIDRGQFGKDKKQGDWSN